MAAAVSASETFIAPVRPFRRGVEQQDHGVWKLPPHHVADIRDVTRGVEETDAGVCCKYLVDSLSGAGSDFDEVALEAAENFCEQNGIWKVKEVASWRDRIRRCRRALERMHRAGAHKQVSVLHVVYGYPDPWTRDMPKKVFDTLGDLASLARYTDAVEVRRQDLARIEATEASNRKVEITPTRDLPSHWKGSNDEISEYDDRVQTGDEISTMAIRQRLPVNGAPFLAEVMRHREYYESALRIITSSDALRAMLAPASEQENEESDEHYAERRVNVEAKRDLFIVQVKIEAIKMLEAASIMYHRAWLQSAG